MTDQTTNITRENGCYYSWCPLSCIGPLSRRIKNSYFINIGTRECAYFIQMGLSRRDELDAPFSFAILEDADIGSGNIFEPLRGLVGKIHGGSKPEVIFLMGSCSTEIMKFDLFELSHKLTAEFNIPVIPVQTSGMCNSQADGEDMALSGLVDFCCSRFTGAELEDETEKVVLVGSVSEYTALMLKNEMKKFRIPFAGIFPGNNISGTLEISKNMGKNSIIVPLYPYLSKTIRKIKQRYKCKIFNTTFPIGHDGSKIFYSDLCEHFGVSADAVCDAADSVWKDMEVKANLLKNRKIFIIGDGLFEIPAARFFSNIGANVVEVSTPRINPSMGKELSILEPGISVVEAADVFSQFKRIEREKPDMVVAHLSLARAFQAQGFLTFPTVIYMRSEFLGFSNAKHLVEFVPHGTDIGVGLFHPKGISEERAFMREVTKKVSEGVVKLSKEEIEKYLKVLDKK
ncbi:MAG: hypothetical protein A7316_05770 [Candidatus Altiarchaeales archaeon WOR_SM1_86-2]|nr:MAG: hypothetical protein A7316_05770 [Candidatus Altiarchaeales archaeon WOR_SM1_86-2]